MVENLKKLAIESGAVSWSRPPMRAVTGLAFSDAALATFAAELSKANYSLFQEAVNRIQKTDAEKDSALAANAQLIEFISELSKSFTGTYAADIRSDDERDAHQSLWHRKAMELLRANNVKVIS